jgi:hypothetical protein
VRRRKGELTDFASIADSVVRRLDPEGRFEEARVISMWEEVAGEEIARHTRGFSLKRGELLVFVDSNTWANELSLMAEPLRDSLNAAVGERLVESMRFVPSRHAKGARPGRVEERREGRRKPPPKRDLSEREQARIHDSAAVIEQESAREAAERLMRKAMEREPLGEQPGEASGED